MTTEKHDKPLITAGVFLGIGLGGFVDGILFHQILQIHSMVSATHPPDTVVNLQLNMVWDGFFHVLTWTMTVIGLVLLWKAIKNPQVPLAGKTLFGAAVLGWGLFNLVEGVIDHHILHVHHLVERLGISIYDYVFLGSGVLMIGIGALIIRISRIEHAA